VSDDTQNAPTASSITKGVDGNIESGGKVEKPKVAEKDKAQEGTYLPI